MPLVQIPQTPDASVPSRKPTRREFLSGQAAVDALGVALDGVSQADSKLSGATPRPTAADGLRPFIRHYARRAMACEFEVTVPTSPDSSEADGILAALDLVESLEQQMSVFRADSEISRINQLAAHSPVTVEPRLFALLNMCQQLWRETDGAFDITSTPLTRAWGFARQQGAVPDDAMLAEARSRVGFQHVKLDEQAGTIRFAMPGVELNLGAIGKGYALDRCAELLKQRFQEDFLWHAGRSSMLAEGSRSQDDPSGWPIAIGDPLHPGRPLGEFQLQDAAVGTSGSSQQFFRHEGKRYGHVIDPRSGRPAERTVFVSVVAPSAAEADALSTAFYILGYDKAADYCESAPGRGFVMLSRETTNGPVRLRTAGLREDSLSLAGKDS